MAICFTYSKVYVSMLLSPYIPPSPSSLHPTPTPCRVQKSVLYVCVSIAAQHVGSSVTTKGLLYVVTGVVAGEGVEDEALLGSCLLKLLENNILQ